MGAETHSYRRSHERDIVVVSWTGTYRLGIMKQDSIDPDNVDHGCVPILQHSQARYSLRQFGMSYGKEQHEYCW